MLCYFILPKFFILFRVRHHFFLAMESEMADNAKQHALTDDFDIPTREQWHEEALKLLKGAPFDKIMRTKTYEEIELQPIYSTIKEMEKQIAGNLPGRAPYTRGSRAVSPFIKPWLIAQEIPALSLKDFNTALKYDLERGQNALRILLDQASMQGLDSDQTETGQVFRDGLPLSTLDDMETMLDGITIQHVPVQIRAGSSGMYAAAYLLAYCKKHDIDYNTVSVSVESDPLAEWLTYGKLRVHIDRAFDEMGLLTKWTAEHAKQFRTMGIDTNIYHNAGASADQELAVCLATGVTYIRALIERDVPIEHIAPRITLSFGIGPHFFMEIAKLRAARVLWSKIIESFGGAADIRRAHIHARTSLRNKTVCDAHNNMLRTTTEAFSAILGGCDSLHVGPYDEVFRIPDAFSCRIARNQQLILKEECHADRVIDPAGGSWYVESLTARLAEKAWDIFREIEAGGGIVQQIRSGDLQKQIAKVRAARIHNLSIRKEKRIGINVYPKAGESAPEGSARKPESGFKARSEYLQNFRTSGDINKHLEPLEKLTNLLETSQENLMDAIIEAAFCSATIGEINTTLRGESRMDDHIEPLNRERESEPFEKLRHAVRDSGNIPSVFPVKLGTVAEYKARADFAAGFLSVAGFSILDPPGYETVEEALTAIGEAAPDVVVICSTDDRYPEMVPALTKAVKEQDPNRCVLLAGYPKDQIEAFKKTGVDDFIHIKSDVYATLVSLSKRLGVPV